MFLKNFTIIIMLLESTHFHPYASLVMYPINISQSAVLLDNDTAAPVVTLRNIRVYIYYYFYYIMNYTHLKDH